MNTDSLKREARFYGLDLEPDDYDAYESVLDMLVRDISSEWVHFAEISYDVKKNLTPATRHATRPRGLGVREGARTVTVTLEYEVPPGDRHVDGVTTEEIREAARTDLLG